MEVTPISLPDLPAETRLTVTLFGFENEIQIVDPGQVGELQLDYGRWEVIGVGKLQFDSPGRWKVIGRAERPVGIDDELADRRLFFAIVTPDRSGSFRFRCHIYCQQVLLQSRLVTLRVETALDRQVRHDSERGQDSWELEWSRTQTDKRTLESVVDYVLSKSLDPVQLAKLPPYRLSMMLNDNGDGTHDFRCFGRDGKCYLNASASIPGNTLKQLLAMPRHALNSISSGIQMTGVRTTRSSNIYIEMAFAIISAWPMISLSWPWPVSGATASSSKRSVLSIQRTWRN